MRKLTASSDMVKRMSVKSKYETKLYILAIPSTLLSIWFPPTGSSGHNREFFVYI